MVVLLCLLVHWWMERDCGLVTLYCMRGEQEREARKKRKARGTESEGNKCREKSSTPAATRGARVCAYARMQPVREDVTSTQNAVGVLFTSINNKAVKRKKKSVETQADTIVRCNFILMWLIDFGISPQH